MKTKKISIFIGLIITFNTFAVTRYVNVNNSSPVSPYTSPANAANTIQEAVDVAINGDIIKVADGVYSTGAQITPAGGTLSNRIVVTSNIIIESETGPENTIISGESDSGTGGPGNSAMRCIYLTNSATLSGFTLSNGFTRTSGDMSLEQSGGGAFLDGGCISNCIVTMNAANTRGGGIFVNLGGCVYDSVINFNNSYGSFPSGGGIFALTESEINRCVVHNNFATNSSGGQGAGIYSFGNANPATTNFVRNCLVYNNLAYRVGGGVFNNENITIIENCTIINNNCISTNATGIGLFLLAGEAYNSIIYYNTNSAGVDQSCRAMSATVRYNCSQSLSVSDGNITNDPQFKSQNDYHILITSPCVSAGTNAFAAMPFDIDGNDRILNSTVDMGCYEYTPEPGLFFVYCLSFGVYYLTKRFN